MYFHHGIRLDVPSGVYPPSDDSLLLSNAIEPRGKVLELGTGSGIIAIYLAKKGHDVVATDINAKALDCAKENARTNGVEDKVNVVRADLMNGIKGPFDTIVFNPPYLPSRSLGELRGPGELGYEARQGGLFEGQGIGGLNQFTPTRPVGLDPDEKEHGPKAEVDDDHEASDEPEEPEDLYSRSWQGGLGGGEVIQRFIGELNEHLAKGGRGYIVLSSLTNFKLPEDSGLEARVVADRSFPFERIFVVEVFRRGEEGL